MWIQRCPAQRPLAVVSRTEKKTAPVLEAVGDQLPFGQVIQPSQLPAAVSARVKRREALVASLQLHRERERRFRGGGSQPEVQ